MRRAAGALLGAKRPGVVVFGAGRGPGARRRAAQASGQPRPRDAYGAQVQRQRALARHSAAASPKASPIPPTE